MEELIEKLFIYIYTDKIPPLPSFKTNLYTAVILRALIGRLTTKTRGRVNPISLAECESRPGDILYNGTVVAAVKRQKEFTQLREPVTGRRTVFKRVHYFANATNTRRFSRRRMPARYFPATCFNRTTRRQNRLRNGSAARRLIVQKVRPRESVNLKLG